MISISPLPRSLRAMFSAMISGRSSKRSSLMARAVVASRVNLALCSGFASSWWFELFGGLATRDMPLVQFAAPSLSSSCLVKHSDENGLRALWMHAICYIDVYASFKLART
jgi:hypothetical protein